ncbi:MAG TPA: hypothetical protein DDY49_10400 [Paenibacillaceae bacterium]|nr:hypothetical protein [Paenibacillaceae bacterium]
MVAKLVDESDIEHSPFEQMRLKREILIKNLYQKIETYEKKRAQETVAYHKMSAFRKLLAAKTPNHHLAVEYLVYVKQPMEEIERLNKEISLITWMADKQEILPQFKAEFLYFVNK